MSFKLAVLGAICATVFISGAMTAQAQQAPSGSCLMPSGQWCYPLIKAPIGQYCECATSNGTVPGSMR